MFQIRIADLQIQICNRFDDIERLCEAYRTEEHPVAIEAMVSNDALDRERIAAGEGFSDGYLETLAVYRTIGERLPYFDAFIFHSAVIEADGRAYAFAAKSGTGKSTHIRHWKNAFGDRIKIVNGDKPIFRYIDGVLYACGTPWAGKEGWQRNVCVPLAGICCLERGARNAIVPITGIEALPKLLSQIYLPLDRNAAELTAKLMDRMLRDTPLWSLQCTDDVQAAQIAAEAMLKKTCANAVETDRTIG